MAKHYRWLVGLIGILTLISGCTIHPWVLELPKMAETNSIIITETSFKSGAPCENRFVAHDLNHITTITGDVVTMFDSNGAGLAINDLDNDGDLDLVLANLAGYNTIFWNEGDLTFRKETLSHGQSRGVNIVDINADGWLDIIFAHRRLRPQVWLNQGDKARSTSVSFSQLARFDVEQIAYTMAWADLDGDLDLDVVAATYQTEHQREEAGNWGGGGVIYYENQNGVLLPTDLALKSQALALLLVDLNGDDQLDIWVGHDFLLPDQVWFRTTSGWEEAHPFETMTQNTMSFTAGDINNDGHSELFAADMKPFQDDPMTLAAWKPLMITMHEMDIVNDAQIMENVLQMTATGANFVNQANDVGLAATGWSWSAKFGDLDNDGFLDLYVVNGMAAAEMFSHLPRNELVEENLVFRNQGNRNNRFQPMPEWELNATAGGRSMTMADLDGDGDLDVVVNNLLAPAQLFENRLCGGSGLTIDLLWPNSPNSRAIGAKLQLFTDKGTFSREIRSASGYLSGDPSQIHIGFPASSQLQKLEIRWPDGQLSVIDNLQPNRHLTIERHSN